MKSYNINGPFIFTEASMVKARKKCVEAADRFAVTFAALDWKWGYRDRLYTPTAIDLQKQLDTMLANVVEKMGKMKSRRPNSSVVSVATGGLRVVAEWQDDDNYTQDQPDIHFVFTDDMAVYLCQ